MGRYFKASGKPWSDTDLNKPYYFKGEPDWKNKPDGEPTLYEIKAHKKDLDLLNNPYEHKIKKDMKTTLHKKANLFELANSSLFPNITSQAKWRYAVHPNKLQIADNQHVYQFAIPEADLEKKQPYFVSRLEDGMMPDFGKGANKTGTLQVHKASPNNIYFTMHGGKTITLGLQFRGDKKWIALPKPEGKKKTASNPLASMMNTGISGLNVAGAAINHPVLAGLAGLGAGGAYDLLKRRFYNTEEENNRETIGDRAKRYLLPSLGLGLGGALVNMTGDSIGDTLQYMEKIEPPFPKSNINIDQYQDKLQLKDLSKPFSVRPNTGNINNRFTA